MDERPVAFLDSGIGGIPYAHFFHTRNKSEKIVYAADRANFPYGPRSKENVIELALSLVKRLVLKYDPRLLAIACNAISVSALKAIRDEFQGLPVVGTVPAIKPAVEHSRKRCIAVIGTQRAIEDPYIAELAAEYGPDCVILGESAPDLVEFVEHRWIDASPEERFLAAKLWVDKFREKGADSLVLACTHFLLLKEEFLGAAQNNFGIFDSLEGVTARVESILYEGKKEPGRRGSAEFPAVNPLMIISGDGPAESHWEQLCRHFGFNLEIGL